MPNSDLDLDAIRECLAAASEGPWRTHDTHLGAWGGHTATVLGPERREPGSSPGWDRITTEGIAWLPTFEGSPRESRQNPWNNATFIAAARQDVPALLAEVDRLRELLTKAEAEATTWKTRLVDETTRLRQALNEARIDTRP